MLEETSIQSNYKVKLFNKNEGETITLSGMDIVLPKAPPKTKMLNSKKKKKDQKWERIALPEGFSFDIDESAYTEEEIQFIEDDFERRMNGVWVLIKGVPTWITGTHYFYIQWCKIDVGYPSYRDRDRRFFIFWEACVRDPKAHGMIMVKHRREGATFKGAAIILEFIIRTKRANGGLLSKTGADAKEFFYKLVKMFRSLPPFYQPMIAGNDNPKTLLEFDKPGERMTKATRHVQVSNALESKIEWKNTAENSFDSYKLRRFVCDEGGKWEEANVFKNWQVVKPTLSDKMLGKAFFPSTVNEMTKKGGENFKKIWDQSDVNDRPANNRTKSGLYQYFTPAYDGLEYDNLVFIDEYGASIIETPEVPVMGENGDLVEVGSKEFLDQIRESLKDDTNALAEQKRQFPYVVEEAFRVQTNNCSFDAERLYQQREWNDLHAGRLVTRGNFMWSNEFGGDVRFIPSKTGRWKVSWIDKNEENHNKRIHRLGKVYPGNMDTIVAGADPYDHSTTTDGRRSNGAVYAFKMYNPSQEDSYIFIAEYVNRPSTVFEFYEDVLKQCIFYGHQVLAENNRVGLINWFIEKGFETYLMRRPEVTHTSNSRSQKTPGVPTSGDVVRDAMINMLEMYVYDCCGMNYETGEGGTLYFNHLVDDLLLFDANDWQKYDATVAAGLALLASKKHVRSVEPENTGVSIVRKFRIVGDRSQKIKTKA
jgi:hypothetical protein